MNPLITKPVKKQFFTPGTFILLAIIFIGFSFGVVRLLVGLGAVTNLNNSYPWGIWIAFDVACGVALAAGGFTTAALVDIFGGKKFKPLLRPAVLTAWLGYIMVAVGLMFDLGRYWNIWQPIFHWQGNSVMFELAMCVMTYLIVLSFEVFPSILEGLRQRIQHKEWGWRLLTKIEGPIRAVQGWLRIILPLFIVAGVVLSCMHQSSLGSVMVIAQNKLSALWQTPFLPALFLLSAIMVGFPMVIIESITASKGLNRKIEIDILEPFAAKIPWFIGIYALLKFADLIFRSNQLDFLERPSATISLVVEISIGIIIPFVLLIFKPLRRSVGWLLTASIMVVFGVILNRFNVFLIGYNPNFVKTSYYPAVGEIAMTLGLICILILLYRFFVNYFPILPDSHEMGAASEGQIPNGKDINGSIQPKMAWSFRASAIIFLVSFIVLYVFVHKKAIAEAQKTYGEIKVARIEHAPPAQPASFSHLFRPDKYRNFYIINSPVLNSGTEYYEPVRFSHRTHDNYVDGNCATCHHRVSDSARDRVGDDLKEMHESIEIRLGGACSTCHEDLNEKEFQKCADCHLRSNEEDYPARIGLKGAYHQQCIGCHAMQPESANAPVDCNGCHHPLTPDHTKLLPGGAEYTATQVTTQCLSCHDQVGRDVLKTAHWNWKGLTPYIVGHEHSINTGLTKTVTNYTVTMLPDLADTASYHIGYTPEGSLPDLRDPSRIDCLICHDTTGTYKRDGKDGGMPGTDINLAQVSRKVGRPSRNNCGSCHFYDGGGLNVKHGDLESVLKDPPAEFDIHMGMVDMRCQDCHKVNKHQVAGMSFGAPAIEGRVNCEQCHGHQPHGISGLLSRHLDNHVKAIACETCHIPFIAKMLPTRLSVDFSTAGQDRPEALDSQGLPTYDKKWGSMTWGKMVVPVYRWFDGNRKSYLLGEKFDVDEVLELNTPLGEKHIPESRIFPFKIHSAKQPYDVENEYLVAVKFKNSFWKDYDWGKAIEDGMKAVGLDYSGKFGFVETRMYSSIHHEVVPASKSLGCADCHSTEAVQCSRCHQKGLALEDTAHIQKVYPQVDKRIDFGALGYEDDPAKIGGRFYMRFKRSEK